jgi:hypothetical protein
MQTLHDFSSIVLAEVYLEIYVVGDVTSFMKLYGQATYYEEIDPMIYQRLDQSAVPMECVKLIVDHGFSLSRLAFRPHRVHQSGYAASRLFTPSRREWHERAPWSCPSGRV